ncbi:hypothetical protein [Streptomyces bungoensis]|uniref:hypothetical protein n=1 Tax=Streptomyces bungoensis TaxID=285568 RepID=UPI003441D0AA
MKRQRADELALCMKKLAHPRRVYVRSGRLASTANGLNGVRAALADQVRALLQQLWKDWEQDATGLDGPASAQQVQEALEPLAADRAVELMSQLAAECLVWPGAGFMERSATDAVARRVAQLLGPGAHWWSNYDPELACYSSAVTPCTFDGLIAGTDGHRFTVLIQVGED